MKKVLILSLVLTSVFSFVGCSKESSEFESVDSKYVESKIGSDNFILIDARHNSYFIGNTNKEIKNGGYISGATDFSASWLNVKDVDKRLELAMKDKGIKSDSEVVVYSNDDSESKKVAQYFSDNGVSDVKIFNSKEYINNNPDKLTKYENFEYFIPAYGVNELLSGNDYQDIKASDAKFFEVSWGEEKDSSYTKGHIPTSVHINTDEIESAPLWSLNSDSDLIKFLANNGINKDDTIILSAAENHMAPSRLALILRYLGVENVHILNGGTTAFESAGYKLETSSNPKQSIEASDITTPLNPNLIDTKEEVQVMLASDDSILVDARTKDEWEGQTSGYGDLENKGRIKGAVYHGGTKGETPGDVFDYTNVDGTMRNFDEVLKMWEDAGIDYNKHLSFYCGSGWRVAEIVMYSNTYGMDNTSIYSNGWYEWSNLMSDEVETGK